MRIRCSRSIQLLREYSAFSRLLVGEGRRCQLNGGFQACGHAAYIGEGRPLWAEHVDTFAKGGKPPFAAMLTNASLGPGASPTSKWAESSLTAVRHGSCIDAAKTVSRTARGAIDGCLP